MHTFRGQLSQQKLSYLSIFLFVHPGLHNYSSFFYSFNCVNKTGCFGCKYYNSIKPYKMFLKKKKKKKKAIKCIYSSLQSAINNVYNALLFQPVIVKHVISVLTNTVKCIILSFFKHQIKKLKFLKNNVIVVIPTNHSQFFPNILQLNC